MSPQVTAAIIAASVSILTLIGTLVAQYSGRRATSRDTQRALEEQRRQLDKTLAEQRIRTLNERYTTAAEQLSSDKPAIRLAGIYAIAGLADDWKENRQTCINVLCAHLRMAYEPDPGQDAPEQQRLAFQATREVRHAIIWVISAHLKKDAANFWKDLDFDFKGVVFDGGDFSRAEFSSGNFSFSGAKFSDGWVDFRDARFSGGNVDFSNTEFSGGSVNFSRARFSGGSVNFSRAGFHNGTVTFNRAEFLGSRVDFYLADFFDTVGFIRAQFRRGTVDFRGSGFCDGTADFNGAEFSGADVDFSGANFCGSRVEFDDAIFSSGTVDFSHARFSNITMELHPSVDFSRAQFSGSTVDFTDPADWSFPPAFPWTDIPPSGVKISETKDQSPA